MKTHADTRTRTYDDKNNNLRCQQD